MPKAPMLPTDKRSAEDAEGSFSSLMIRAQPQIIDLERASFVFRGKTIPGSALAELLGIAAAAIATSGDDS